MYFIDPKGRFVNDLDRVGKTKSGSPIYANPGPGWTAAGPGERVRQNRDGLYVVSKVKART